MRIPLKPTLLLLLFAQLSFSQDINYEALTQIIVGDYHTPEDVEIIKADILNGDKKQDAIKLLKTNDYLYETVDIDGKQINKSCAAEYIAKEKDKVLTEQLRKEVLELKKKHETVGLSDYQVTKLNTKIKTSNELIVKQNQAVDNFEMCITTQRAIRKDFNDMVDTFYTAYTIKKTTAIATKD